MKKLALIIILLMWAGVAQAQCTAEVTDVKMDEIRGSIIVETVYTLNSVVVQTGQTRYLETSGTNEEIIAKAKEDIAIHCENLIRRIPENRAYINAKRLEEQKKLTQPIIDVIKVDLVGEKETKTEAVDTFKGKDIKVTYDSKNSISLSVIAIP